MDYQNLAVPYSFHLTLNRIDNNLLPLLLTYNDSRIINQILHIYLIPTCLVGSSYDRKMISPLFLYILGYCYTNCFPHLLSFAEKCTAFKLSRIRKFTVHDSMLRNEILRCFYFPLCVSFSTSAFPRRPSFNVKKPN